MGVLPGVGDRLGRFEIRRKLGRGGMGLVYLARDTALEIDVVLKVLLPNLAKEGNIHRFQREVLLARRVAHPGVCRLFDIHEEDDLHFISMEYVDGKPLAAVIKEQGMLDAGRAVQIVRQVCDAIEAAHALDIIHRDLKPGNVIVGPDDRVSVLDFGLSKALDLASITVTNVRVGTLQYMAPEVVRGREAASLSDIYSIGVILYECVTGRLPFDGSGEPDISEAIKAGKAVPANKYNTSITSILQTVILKAMALGPERRFRDARAFKEALDVVIGASVPSPVPATEVPEARHEDVGQQAQDVFVDPSYSQVLKSRTRNTTILFCDILGITQFLDEHGDAAGRQRIRSVHGLIIPVVQRYGGEIVKTLGDAIMAIFDTADDGVGAAIGLQRAVEEDNAGKPDHERAQLRVGIHSGKSVLENRDVFGSTVDLAARICTQGHGSLILISSEARDMLHPDLHPTSFLKNLKVPGKARPVRVYALHWGPLGPLIDEKTGKFERSPIFDELAEVPTDTREKQPLPAVSWWSIHARGLAAAGGVGLALILLLILVLATGNESEPEADRSPARSDTGTEPALQPTPDPPVHHESVAGPSQETLDEPPREPPAETPQVAENGADSPPMEEVESPAPVRPVASAEAQARSLWREIRSIMKSRGIIRGDHERLDREISRMSRLKKKGYHRDATRAGKRARSILREIRIDRSLVKAKLMRFNKMYTRSDRSDNADLWGLSDDINRAYGAGKYKKANRLLNRAIRILKPS